MQSMIKWAKRTIIGRFLCRIAGDKAGGVMMEYVILAVLIAAAAVVAVAVFGKTIVGMFNVAGKGAAGQHEAAKGALDATVLEQEDGAANKAAPYHDGMHDGGGG